MATKPASKANKKPAKKRFVVLSDRCTLGPAGTVIDAVDIDLPGPLLAAGHIARKD